MTKIHLNCDLGEGGKHDEELMPYISACNIACGGHAGTIESMQKTVELAIEHGVEIGAHPSYPDKRGFGRISIKMEPAELRRSLVEQILSIKRIAEAKGAALIHIKPHGALYHDAMNDKKTADIILEAIDAFTDKLVIYAPEHSKLAEMAGKTIPVKLEAFADRTYEPDGSLVARSLPGAVIKQKQQVYEHLISMIQKKKIRCLNGIEIPCHAHTFCLHSDTENAVGILKFLHMKFKQENIKTL